jgi:hypothetical protein
LPSSRDSVAKFGDLDRTFTFGRSGVPAEIAQEQMKSNHPLLRLALPDAAWRLLASRDTTCGSMADSSTQTIERLPLPPRSNSRARRRRRNFCTHGQETA